MGFDACVDYKAGRLNSDLAKALPHGIDCLFENVGGPILDALLLHMNSFSRVALCGLIAEYDTPTPHGMKNLRSVLINRIRIQGFIVSDDMTLWSKAVIELAGQIARGGIKFRETVAHGLPSAPAAFIGMLHGRNFGKQLAEL